MSNKSDIDLLQKENQELKKELEEIVKVNRQRFELAMQATNDGLFDWNLLTNEIYYSPAWKQMLGYENNELPNEPSVLEKITHPDDFKEAMKRISAQITGKADRLEMELQLKHKSGHWLTVLSRANVLRNNEGKAIRLVGLNIDITERKHAEKALIQSEKRLVESQSVARIGHYNLDISTGNWTNSKELNAIFGIGDSYKRTVEGWKKLMHPDDADRIYKYLIHYVIAKTQRFNKEYRIIDQRTGEVKWVHGLGELKLNAEGKPLEMFGTIQDITERKNLETTISESEETHRLLFESAGVGIGQYSMDGTIIALNPKALSHLGASLNEVVGRNITDVFGSEGKIYLNRIKLAAKAEGESVFFDEVELPGGKNWFRSTYNPIKDYEGKVKGVIIISDDITEQKEIEEALRISEERFRTLADNVPGTIYLCLHDEQFSKLYLNDTVENLTGYNRKEILNNKVLILNLIHPDDRKNIRLQVDASIEKQQPFHLQYRLQHKKGNWIWIEEFGAGVYTNGKVHYLEGLMLDITQRKLEEEMKAAQLRLIEYASEHSYQELISQFLDEAEKITNSELSACYILNDNEQTIIQKVFSGNLSKRLKNKNIAEVNFGSWESSLEQRIPLINHNLLTAHGKNAQEKGSIQFKQELSIPVFHENRIAAVLFLANEHFPYTQKDIDILSDFSNQAWEVIARKKTEEAFLMEQRKAGNILESTGAGTWEWNIITGELILNERWAQIIGYTLDELKPISFNTWEKQVHPDDLADAKNRIQQHFTDGSEYIAEYRLKHKEGHWVWINARGRVIEWDNAGEPLLMYGTHLDITQSKQAEEALQRSQQRLDLSLRGANLGLWDWNVQTGEVVFNDRWAEIIGYTLEELHPISLSTWIENTHPDDLEQSNKLLEAHFNRETEYYECEARMKHKKGHWVWVLDRGKVFEWTPDGKPLRMSGTHLDITERKYSEEALRASENKYRLLFENMTSGFALHEMLFDKSGNPIDYRFIEINPEFEKHTGLKSSRILQKTVREVLPDTEEYWIQKYGQVVKSGDPLIYENYSGELNKYFRVHAYRTAPNYFAVMVTDITEQRTIQHAIEENEKQLRLIFDNSPAIMLLLNKETEIVKVNQTGLRYAGATLDDVLRQQAGDIFRCIHALKSEKGCGTGQSCKSCAIRTTVLNTIRTNTPAKKIETSLTVVNKNGQNQTLVFLLSVTPAGNLPEPIYLVTLDDITLQKNAELELENSYIKYKTLAEHTYDWEFWKGPDDLFIYVSPACERITGYTNEQFMKNPQLFKALIHADDINKWMEHEAKAARKIFCKNPIEFRIRTKAGKQKWINHVCQPVFDDRGVFLGNRGTNRDITVQKLSQIALTESEVRFKQLAELTFEGILIHRRETVVDINKALEELLGYSRNELLGQNGIAKCIPKKYQETVQEIMQKDINKPLEIEMISSDGSTIEVEVISRYISTEDNLRVIAIRDITEQKYMQQQILNTIISTEEQERKRIAQELHDGLGPVLSTIKLYTQTYLNSTDAAFKEKIEEQLLSGIDEALTQVSTISNNLSPHILTDFGLQVAIQKFIDKLSKVTNLKFDFNYSLDAAVRKDIEITLYRVTIELINNTRKHAKAKHVELHIKNENSLLSLVYTDDGIGFKINEKLNNKLGMGLFNIVNRIKSFGGEVNFMQPIQGGMLCKVEIPIAG